jgi:hypothetical protein
VLRHREYTAMPPKGSKVQKLKGTKKASNILWVNRTSQNLKSRTAAEDVAIRKHVHGWRRARSGRASKSDRPAAVTPEGLNGQDDRVSTTESESSGDSAPASPRHRQVDMDDSVVESSRMALLRGPGSHFDPFASTASPMTPDTIELLQHCERFHLFAAWPRLTGAIGYTTADWTANLGDALTDALHSSAFFACGAFARTQSRKFEPKSFHTYLTSKQSAIVALRQSIETQQLGKSTVLAIMHMVALEHQSGHFKEAIEIQRGAKTIIEQLGSAVRWKAHEMAFITDIWLSVDTMEYGCFEPEAFDPGPWTRQSAVRQLDYAAIHDLSTFKQEVADLQPANQLRGLFAAIRELTAVYDWLHITRSVEEKSKAALWLQMRATATKRRLMTYLIRTRAASKRATGLLRENLEMAMCNSAVCYVCFAFVSTDFIGIAPAGPQSVSSQIVTRVLYEAELATPEDRDDAALLWVLFVQIAQQQYSRPDLAHDSEIAPFKQKFAEILSRLECSSWLQAKRILQRYLYRPQLMDSILRDLYDDFEMASPG